MKNCRLRDCRWQMERLHAVVVAVACVLWPSASYAQLIAPRERAVINTLTRKLLGDTFPTRAAAQRIEGQIMLHTAVCPGERLRSASVLYRHPGQSDSGEVIW